jgi:hypothetical protein
MSSQGIYISVVLEPDEDFPIADIVFDGVHWASATMRDGELQLTIYGETRPHIPLDRAIESLERARTQLRELIPESGPRAEQ